MSTEAERYRAKAAGYRNLLRRPRTWYPFERRDIDASIRYWERMAEECRRIRR